MTSDKRGLRARRPNSGTFGTASIAFLLAALLLLMSALGGCIATNGGLNGGTDLATETSYVSPYDTRSLIREENGRFGYWQDGVRVSRLGVDVSSYQGAINWEAVAADGIDFAFLRIGHRGYTEGEVYLDDFFEPNYAGASKAGLPIGVYFFSQALTEDEAREEARFVVEALAGRPLAYPVVYDFESVSDPNGRANALDSRQRTRNALAFCEYIEQAGYTPMLYGNARDRAHYYTEPLASYLFWFAEYDTKFPSGRFDFAIWQYSSSGQVAGIATSVDMNLEFIGSASAH